MKQCPACTWTRILYLNEGKRSKFVSCFLFTFVETFRSAVGDKTAVGLEG